MKSEEGSVEIGSVFILFFLSALLSGAILFASALVKYFERYSDYNHEKDKAVNVLYEITELLQPQKNEAYDFRNSYLIQSLESKYRAYNLEIKDVSSGYHLDFLSDKDLEDPRICSYLFLNNSASQFIIFRNMRGLSADLESLKPYIKAEAWDSCVSYGWINRNQSESFAFRHARQEFKSIDIMDLFPLVNDFPLININMVSPDILNPLILRPDFKIEKPEEKIEKLKNRLLIGPVSIPDISSLLNTPVTNPVFDYLGTKTTFWEISFRLRPRIMAKGIVGAIPDKYGERQDIQEYVLIDRTIRYEYEEN
jgi:hypothetical protein